MGQEAAWSARESWDAYGDRLMAFWKSVAQGLRACTFLRGRRRVRDNHQSSAVTILRQAAHIGSHVTRQLSESGHKAVVYVFSVNAEAPLHG